MNTVIDLHTATGIHAYLSMGFILIVCLMAMGVSIVRLDQINTITNVCQQAVRLTQLRKAWYLSWLLFSLVIIPFGAYNFMLIFRGY